MEKRQTVGDAEVGTEKFDGIDSELSEQSEQSSGGFDFEAIMAQNKQKKDAAKKRREADNKKLIRSLKNG